MEADMGRVRYLPRERLDFRRISTVIDVHHALTRAFGTGKAARVTRTIISFARARARNGSQSAALLPACRACLRDAFPSLEPLFLPVMRVIPDRRVASRVSIRHGENRVDTCEMLEIRVKSLSETFNQSGAARGSFIAYL